MRSSRLHRHCCCTQPRSDAPVRQRRPLFPVVSGHLLLLLLLLLPLLLPLLPQGLPHLICSARVPSTRARSNFVR